MIETGWHPDFRCLCGYEEASDRAKNYNACPNCGALRDAETEGEKGKEVVPSSGTLLVSGECLGESGGFVINLSEHSDREWPEVVYEDILDAETIER